MRLWVNFILNIVFMVCAIPATIQAQTQSAPQDSQIVDYAASFFDRYQPSTALEIVSQVPGFVLNDGDSERGFGGAVGNVLINDIMMHWFGLVSA